MFVIVHVLYYIRRFLHFLYNKQGNRRYQTSPAVCNRTARW